MQCKVKINQHRPEARVDLRALYAAGDDHQRDLVSWMDTIEESRGR